MAVEPRGAYQYSYSRVTQSRSGSRSYYHLGHVGLQLLTRYPKVVQGVSSTARTVQSGVMGGKYEQAT